MSEKNSSQKASEKEKPGKRSIKKKQTAFVYYQGGKHTRVARSLTLRSGTTLEQELRRLQKIGWSNIRKVGYHQAANQLHAGDKDNCVKCQVDKNTTSLTPSSKPQDLQNLRHYVCLIAYDNAEQHLTVLYRPVDQTQIMICCAIYDFLMDVAPTIELKDKGDTDFNSHLDPDARIIKVSVPKALSNARSMLRKYLGHEWISHVTSKSRILNSGPWVLNMQIYPKTDKQGVSPGVYKATIDNLKLENYAMNGESLLDYKAAYKQRQSKVNLRNQGKDKGVFKQ